MYDPCIVQNAMHLQVSLVSAWSVLNTSGTPTTLRAPRRVVGTPGVLVLAN